MLVKMPHTFATQSGGLLRQCLLTSFTTEVAMYHQHLCALVICAHVQAGVKHVMLTLGSQGAALCTLRSGTDVLAQHLPALPARIVNTNGAGDCLVAGSLACLVQGQTPISALAFGMVSKMRLQGHPFGICQRAWGSSA